MTWTTFIYLILLIAVIYVMFGEQVFKINIWKQSGGYLTMNESTDIYKNVKKLIQKIWNDHQVVLDKIDIDWLDISSAEKKRLYYT
jgi:hypothetical protein